eukprot:Trichotokara_eunicae@DN4024_c0_g1_i1.p1
MFFLLCTFLSYLFYIEPSRADAEAVGRGLFSLPKFHTDAVGRELFSLPKLDISIAPSNPRRLEVRPSSSVFSLVNLLSASWTATNAENAVGAKTGFLYSSASPCTLR